MDDFLKGNFKVKNSITLKDSEKKEPSKKLTEELRKKTLASLGGSMVYIERTPLIWDGHE